jgi:hypothetical protein
MALTFFREEINLRVLALFGALLAARFFHTVLDERVNYVRGWALQERREAWGVNRAVAAHGATPDAAPRGT